jgi:hypothetical protein
MFRYSLNSVIPYLNEPVKIKAQYILHDFIESANDKNNVFQSFLHFVRGVDFICKFYKKRTKIRFIRRYTLDKFWDKMFVSITQSNLMVKGKSKKIAKIMKKLYSISDDTKN